MKEYKVLQGIIFGIPAGQTITLTDDQAKTFGSQYVELISQTKQEKQVIEATENKQIKTTQKKK